MSEAQKDYHERLESLTAELRSMKADYQKELHKTSAGLPQTYSCLQPACREFSRCESRGKHQ